MSSFGLSISIIKIDYEPNTNAVPHSVPLSSLLFLLRLQVQAKGL